MLTSTDLEELERDAEGWDTAVAAAREIRELRDRNEKLERIAKIAEIIQEDVRESTWEYLQANGWVRQESGFWTEPGGFSEGYYPDTAISMELDRALNALALTGG